MKKRYIVLLVCLILIIYGSIEILPYIVFNIVNSKLHEDSFSVTMPKSMSLSKKGISFNKFDIVYDDKYIVFVSELLIDYNSILKYKKYLKIKAYNLHFSFKDVPNNYDFGDFNLDMQLEFTPNGNTIIKKAVINGDYLSGNIKGIIKNDNNIDVYSDLLISPNLLLQAGHFNIPFLDNKYALKVKLSGNIKKPLIALESDLFKFTINKKK